MLISGLALLMIGVLSLFSHQKANSGSVRHVQAADTPKNPGGGQPHATLADAAALVAALLRTDENSSDPTPIDVASEPPVAVNEAPADPRPDPRTGPESPTPMARASAAALPEPPIPANSDAGAKAPIPEPVTGGGDFGTALTFARNPAEAAKLAKRDKKLAFFLHVSGNFEESGFT